MKNVIYSTIIGFFLSLVIVACAEQIQTSVSVAQIESTDVFEFEETFDEETEDGVTYVQFEDNETPIVVGRTSRSAKVKMNDVSSRIMERPEQRLILGQCILAEGGWSSRDDWNSIMSVLINRSQKVSRWQGRPIDELAAQYCHALWPSRRNNAWVHGLEWRDMDTPPEGWPDTMPWERYRQKWNSIQNLVNGVLDGQTTLHGCNASHWGARNDNAPASWEIVNCGQTNNIFYR